MTTLFYWTGALTWACVAICVAILAVWKARTRNTPVPPAPVMVWRMGPYRNPHPWPTETVWHVETDDAADAWRAIGGSAA